MNKKLYVAALILILLLPAVQLNGMEAKKGLSAMEKLEMKMKQETDSIGRTKTHEELHLRRRLIKRNLKDNIDLLLANESELFRKTTLESFYVLLNLAVKNRRAELQKREMAMEELTVEVAEKAAKAFEKINSKEGLLEAKEELKKIWFGRARERLERLGALKEAEGAAAILKRYWQKLDAPLNLAIKKRDKELRRIAIVKSMEGLTSAAYRWVAETFEKINSMEALNKAKEKGKELWRSRADITMKLLKKELGIKEAERFSILKPYQDKFYLALNLAADNRRKEIRDKIEGKIMDSLNQLANALGDLSKS